jgi:hypothetical protein
MGVAVAATVVVAGIETVVAFSDGGTNTGCEIRAVAGRDCARRTGVTDLRFFPERECVGKQMQT